MATKKSGSTKKKGASKKATAEAAAPSAAKLKAVQKKLNEDTRLRNQFLKDPAGVLRKQGVELESETASKLEKYLKDLAAPQREVFGAQLVRIRIGVRVRIRIMINIGVTL